MEKGKFCYDNIAKISLPIARVQHLPTQAHSQSESDNSNSELMAVEWLVTTRNSKGVPS